MDQRVGGHSRIAKNTIFLYFRMLLIMGVNLYMSRLVLEILGVEDYGLYNVIGGMVVLFSLLSSSLSSSVTRFLSFELGRNRADRLETIFSISLSIYVVLALLIFILVEVVGVWALDNYLNIPESRRYAAFWALQFSLLTFVVNLVSVPYNAVIIAHEHMKAFAYISILEALLKLVSVFILRELPFDKLILYASFLFSVALLVRVFYGLYCNTHFSECVWKFKYQRSLVKEMVSFAGWNFIGSSSSLLRSQGVNILTNVYCGPVVNGARAIAFQLDSGLNAFAANFVQALQPQIVKSYASGDRDYMMSLLYLGSKLSFFLLLFFAWPLLLETVFVLELWLVSVPDHTVLFVRLLVLFSMLESISLVLQHVAKATGRIRDSQLLVGGFQLLNLPIAYILLKKGYFPEITLVVAIILSAMSLLARLWVLRGLVGLSLRSFNQNVLWVILKVCLLSSVLPIALSLSSITQPYRFLSVTVVSVLSVLFSIYTVGCDSSEKKFLKGKLVWILNKRR